MKKARKIVLSIVLALCMAALAACGGGNPNPAPDGGDETEYTYSLTETSITLNEEQTKQLGVNVSPNKEISPSFASENPNVAQVSDSGLITAMGEGNTKINVSVDGKTLACTVTVKAYTLNFTALALVTGQTKQLEVTENGEAVTGVTYESNDTEVAQVSESGLVTAAGVGETTLTVSVDGISIVCTVSVTQSYAYSLNKTSMSLEVGGSESLTVTVTPDKEFDRPLVFSSSNIGVASVNEGNGEVTAVGVGTATITCMADGHELTCSVNVTAARIYSLNQTKAELLLGSSDKNTAQLSVSVSTEEPIGTVEWESSDENVASVADGLVTAVGIGTATVTAKVDGRELECAVAVAIPATISDEDAYGKTYNLTKLDDTYKTLDWVYYGNENDSKKIERMANRTELIGDAPENDRFFGDYRAVMTWHDGQTERTSLRRRDGWVFVDTISQDITVNQDVSKVMMFVGSWQATVKITVSMNGVKLAEESYEGYDRCVKALTVTPDIAQMASDASATLRIQMACVNPSDGGNTCMVGIAVVGNKTRHEALTDTATLTKTELNGQQTDSRNLTEIGTTDWYYTHYEHDDGDHKSGGSAIKWENTEWVGGPNKEWGYKCGFTWSDGTNWTTNPVDKNEDWGGATVSTNNMLFSDNAYTIKIHLGVGTHKVYLYMTGWNAIYNLSVMNADSELILQENIYSNEDGNNHAFEVIVTLVVTEEGDYGFRSDKLGWEGNIGFAAVAVATQEA